MIPLGTILTKTKNLFAKYFKKFEVLELNSGANIDVKTSEIIVRDIKCSSDINIMLPSKSIPK